MKENNRLLKAVFLYLWEIINFNEISTNLNEPKAPFLCKYFINDEGGRHSLPPTHKTKGDGFVRKNEHTLVQLTIS
jgi:hypothetical protein